MPRKPVRVPLSPETLLRLGVIRWQDLTSQPTSVPSTATCYEIWGFHGYVESGNNAVGTLEIETRERSGGGSEIHLRQEVRNADGYVERTVASLTLRRPNLWTPVEWEVERRLTGQGTEVTEAHYRMTGRAQSDEITIVEQGRERRLPVVRSWTCDWCLFAGFWTAESTPRSEMDLFEQLSAWKGPYRWFPMGEQRISWEKEIAVMQRVDLIGPGNLPFEFWFHRNGDLVLILSGDKAFVRRWER